MPTPSSTSASTAPSSGCRARRWPCRAAATPTLAIADVPLFYPFVVNDPGEGTQAKRRAHAVIVDHLPPPLTRADTYDELAQLEQLLDGYAQSAAMDPGKLPAIRDQVWEVLVERRDPPRPRPRRHPSRRADVRRRGPPRRRLPVRAQGRADPRRPARPRDGAGRRGADRHRARGHPPAPGRRPVAAGHRRRRARHRPRRPPAASTSTASRRRAAQRVEALAAVGWDATSTDDPTLRWVASRPRARTCAAAADEIANLLAGLAGRHVPAGPSGAPSRGARPRPADRPQLLLRRPEGDPVARCRGRSAARWPTGSSSATSPRPATYPATVGLVLWGTAAMRTNGDDVAEALALLGVRPTWDEQTRRVTGLEVIPLAELGRPRIDVTLRISGFFRDAFPHVDRAPRRRRRRWSAALDEPPTQNPIAAAGGDDARLWGPPPGGYGSGHPAAHRAALVAHRGGPRRGVPGVVGVRLRPEPPRRGRSPRRCAAGSPPSRWR